MSTEEFTHSTEMKQVLSDTYAGDLTHCFVYGSPMRPMSASWARIDGATFLNANLRTTGYHTYVAVPILLETRVIASYELEFVSGPETEGEGKR